MRDWRNSNAIIFHSSFRSLHIFLTIYTYTGATEHDTKLLKNSKGSNKHYKLRKILHFMSTSALFSLFFSLTKLSPYLSSAPCLQQWHRFWQWLMAIFSSVDTFFKPYWPLRWLAGWLAGWLAPIRVKWHSQRGARTKYYYYYYPTKEPERLFRERIRNHG